jgi:hypothetical protein
MKTDLIFLVIVPSILIGVDFLNGVYLIRLLKSQYPEIWKELDEPGLDIANYSSSRLKLSMFIWGGKFSTLNSNLLSFKCILAMLIQALLFACLLYGLISVVIKQL